MSISKLFAFTLCTIVGLTSVVSAKTPKPHKLPAAPAAAPAKVRAVPIAPEFEIITGFDPSKVVLTIDITKGQTDLHGKTCPSKTIPIVANPTSDASDARQKYLNGVRRDNAMPEECETNDAGMCRSGLLQAGVNNSNGKIFCVLPDGFTTPADLKKLGDKVTELTKDTDKDGVKDIDDKCVEIPAGPTPDPFMAGCPDKDTDKDGLTDHHGDNCPTQPGPLANHGCPVTTTDQPAPAAVAAPAPAPEAPKAAPAKAADKKVFFNVMADVGTEVTVSTPGTVQFGIGFGVCATGSRLNQEIQVGGRVVSKPWYICPTLVLGDQARNYNRNGMDAHHVRVELRLSALTGGRGLNVAGTAPRDRMSANGAFLGPMVEGIVTQALLENNRFLAVYGALAGAEFKGRLGVFTIGVDVAPVGVCSVSKPGYTAGALGQPKAEYCLKAGANLGLTF